MYGECDIYGCAKHAESTLKLARHEIRICKNCRKKAIPIFREFDHAVLDLVAMYQDKVLNIYETFFKACPETPADNNEKD